MARAFNTKVWAYRYDQPNPVLGSAVVAHSAESWMMFNGTRTGNNGTATFSPLDETQLAFSGELIAYWVSFVRDYDPNSFKLSTSPEWVGWGGGEEGGRQMVLRQGGEERDRKGSGSYVEDEDQEERRCDFVARKVGREQN
ncbi:hypothetical protein V5O48_016646 [Marasmius crinis-equi]|uniref:Carboxylesterase type B domain-containing protein n=1 Tax=Marasmius crinis-equi TaxID=585013 RepID=A0ABR3ER46_9AGAR